MAGKTQTIEPAVLPYRTRAGRSVRLRSAFGLAILICAFCISASAVSETADSYPTVISEHLALETEGSGGSVSPQFSDLKRAVMEEVQILPRGRQVAAPPPLSTSAMLAAVLLPLAGLTVLGIICYIINRRLDSLASAHAQAEQRLEKLLAADPSVGQLLRDLHELRDGLIAPVAGESADSPASPQSEAGEGEPVTLTDPVQEFFAVAPGQLASIRKLFSDVSHASDAGVRQDMILELLRQVSSLKDIAGPFQLRPVWLMACALEGLLKQLSRNESEVTHSVLGTLAGALDLLEILRVRGVNPQLATEPAVQLLAVDDDAVSRLAISFALKQAFKAPDLAPDGETALGLVARQTYDVIFLDVDMPGMDGYELSTRIHQTARHRTTPIVFVTRNGDFNSRAQARLSGGESLIAKPYLTFEITVKALTLALRARLQNGVVETPTASKDMSPMQTAVASEAPAEAATSVPAHEPVASPEKPKGQASDVNAVASSSPQKLSFPVVVSASGDDPLKAFFTHAPAYLDQLRDQLQAAQRSSDAVEIQTFLCRLCAGVHSFNLEAERAELRAISRLGSALEAMLIKLLASTKLCTTSALNAAAASLNLLKELCADHQSGPDLTHPPVRILVVDDDPVARRAISGSIQLVFGRPDNADSGEMALTMAVENSFDLIFLDVLMPGIDGFETCKKIHESQLNRCTPVIFVTSHDDAEARSKGLAAGGCGFVPKSVSSSQITLTALTMVLWGRLHQSKSAPAIKATKCLEIA